MASFSPSTWASLHSSSCYPSSTVAAACGTKLLSLPTRRLKCHSGLSASSDSGASAGETEIGDAVQLAFSKAKAYRNGKISTTPIPPVINQKPSAEPALGTPNGSSPETKVPIAAKLAMEKAKEYKKNKVSLPEQKEPGEEHVSLRNSRERSVDKLTKKDGFNISSKDFLGLDFSEKKNYRGIPPGLVTQMEPLLGGNVPEVEIIVGDASKFERITTRASTFSEADDSTGLYKPKVSTWGVFPRPNNISKAFGGGRVIDSGEMLETLEAKKANEKHSRELIAAYKRKNGLTIDAETRAECEKALIEGDSLMELGQLRGALPYYEKVMQTLIFQEHRLQIGRDRRVPQTPELDTDTGAQQQQQQ